MRFLPPAPHRHDTVDRSAVLLINLGTPAAPTRRAVHRYLRQFLLDPRVVEIPRLVWWLLLHMVILPLRSGASAARYAQVWGPEGSPLLAHSRRQVERLAAELERRGLDVDVELAMRYGEPAVESALERLRARGVRRLLVLPMYPQYSATTTASALDAVMAVLARTRDVPELRWVRSFAGHPGYIEALRASVAAHWEAHGRPDRLIMSFHGLPRRNLDLGDPYHCECHRTGRLLGEALGLAPDQAVVSFQSRFGRARWLEPYTLDALRDLARTGVGRVDVVCPGFPADCLETIEEIGIEARREFAAAGGREFHFIACLNDAPALTTALADLVLEHLHGWPVRSADQAARSAAAHASAQRARAKGAAA